MNQPISGLGVGTPALGYDRCGADRLNSDTLARVLADPHTRALLIDGDTVPVDEHGAPRLVPVPEHPGVDVAFLGRLDGTNLVAVYAAADPADGQRASVRDAAPASPAPLAEVLFTAVSLGRWITGARFCPACGGGTDLTTAGWARRCRECDREHFPRTDPAVIVAVSDGDRLLLGSNALWEHNRFSCFAGFVEAGESLESAVAREVFEESGTVVTDIRYAGSQPWPYPRSLMLGFHATATDPAAAEADGEEILEVRWFTRAEIHAALAGESDIMLPGPASIARSLITAWAGTR